MHVGLSIVTAQANDKAVAEIRDLRSKLIDAINNRDRKMLESLYADDFTHTHATGQVDGKAKRIGALLSGDATIESAEADEIKIRIYQIGTAVAVGQSTLKDAQQNPTEYRWTVVYVRIGRKWQIAASQATRLAV